MKHIRIKISGLVQGVFFRYHTQETARAMHIKGYVCNLEDGSVLIEAEGEEELMNAFVEWCHHGPSRAQVEKVECKQVEKLENYENFIIQ